MKSLQKVKKKKKKKKEVNVLTFIGAMGVEKLFFQPAVSMR